MTEEMIKKAIKIIDRIYYEIYSYTYVPDHVNVTLDDYHMLLAYKDKNSPVYVNINAMGDHKVTVFGIPIRTTLPKPIFSQE